MIKVESELRILKKIARPTFFLQVFTDSTNFPIFRRFCNIRNFCSFRKKKTQLLSGPSQSPLLLVFTYSTNFPIFRKFCIIRTCMLTWRYKSIQTPQVKISTSLNIFEERYVILRYSGSWRRWLYLWRSNLDYNQPPFTLRERGF